MPHVPVRYMTDGDDIATLRAAREHPSAAYFDIIGMAADS
jgi:hypothetical protein